MTFYCTWDPFKGATPVVYAFTDISDCRKFVNEMKAAGHKEIRKVSKAEAEKMISNGSKYFDADKVLDKFTIGFRIEEI